MSKDIKNKDIVTSNSEVNKKRKISTINRLSDWLSEDKLNQIEAWSKMGLTNTQIATNIGVARQTFQKWISESNDINDYLMRGREVVVTEVANALVESARGHKAIVKKSYKVKDVWYDDKGKKHESERIEYADEEQYYPPQPQSLQFFLKNKRPDEYKDRVEVRDNESSAKLDTILDKFKQLAKKEDNDEAVEDKETNVDDES